LGGNYFKVVEVRLTLQRQNVVKRI